MSFDTPTTPNHDPCSWIAANRRKPDAETVLLGNATEHESCHGANFPIFVNFSVKPSEQSFLLKTDEMTSQIAFFFFHLTAFYRRRTVSKDW